MSNGLLLWVDDEIELLKAHIIFLEKKGYEVITVSNGPDAIDQCRQQTFDLILLDEMMPGLSGLETLQQIKDIQPATPVVMCTKSEEENIMDQAIGSKIADYLIKPVNPNQILLSLKKNIHQKEIVTEVTQSGYQQDYQQIAMQIMDCRDYQGWMDIYKRLVKWELELCNTDSAMGEMLQMQKEEANIGFAKYIAKNYLDWVDPQTFLAGNRPLMSPDIFKQKVFPAINAGEKVFLVCEGSSGWERLVMRYELRPYTLSDKSGSIGRPFYDGDIWTRDVSPEQWFDELTGENCAYVQLFTINDYFSDTYGDLFEDNEVEEYTLYRVDADRHVLVKCA